jgi:putative endonuclease
MGYPQFTADHFIRLHYKVLWKYDGYFKMKTRKENSRQQKGKSGEDAAARHLEERGFTILERNYRFERGEIDIVAEEGNELVFVEVKSRGSNQFGSPEEAVTEEKQEQIRKVAEGYLFENECHDRICRFDVVAVELHDGTAELRHIRDAF